MYKQHSGTEQHQNAINLRGHKGLWLMQIHVM